MENNNIDIAKEQEVIRHKIKTINESGLFDKLYEKLEEFGNDEIRENPEDTVKLIGRVKKAESACEKIERQGVTADQIYDLIGLMYIVDLPEQYSEAKKTLTNGMPRDSFIHDFDGSLPENNGYSSFHMGVKSDELVKNGQIKELEGLSVEIQLKSYGMYIAQEATHDSIYKNPTLSKEDKDKMQSVMFPMIERTINIQEYQKCLGATIDDKTREEYSQKIFSEEQEILKLKMNNKDFINQNPEQIKTVFNEFILVQYMEKIKDDPLLSMENIDKEQVKSECMKAIENLSSSHSGLSMADSKPTGFKEVDEIYNQIMNSSIKEIQELSISKNEQEKEPQLLESAVECSLDEISSSDIESIVNTVKSKAKEKETPNLENGIAIEDSNTER